MATRIEGGIVHFPEWYDERGEWEAESKGWLQGVQIELPDGKRFPLFFYDPVRLAQDLEADTSQDRPVIAEPGLAVVPEVTRGAIIRAAERLVKERFFDLLKPLSEPLANGVA
jgi:hypothetical protein